MDIKQIAKFPKKIICLTEESVELLFALGEQDRIVGVSSFVKRPLAAQKIKKVSLFTSSNINKILELKPDLVIGFSDIQKDIAKELIGHGVNVYISNQRSIQEIFEYISFVARIVDKDESATILINKLVSKIKEAQEFASTLCRSPKVYFEEWDDPMISSIKWVSELIEICGGRDINSHLANESSAKDRFTSNEEVALKNPDIIFGCWCGKKVKIEHFYKRLEIQNTNAIINKQVFELEPEIFLQPGIAPIVDGIDILINYFKQWSRL